MKVSIRNLKSSIDDLGKKTLSQVNANSFQSILIGKYLRKYGSGQCKPMALSASFEACISCKWSRLNKGCISLKEVDLQEINAHTRAHVQTHTRTHSCFTDYVSFFARF